MVRRVAREFLALKVRAARLGRMDQTIYSIVPVAVEQVGRVLGVARAVVVVVVVPEVMVADSFSEAI
jgi:hypothetical protein